MTTEYEEFIGKEPSLIDLDRFITINKEMFDEYNNECDKDNRKEEKIIEIYYKKWLEAYYAPPDINTFGGEGYITVAIETLIGKK